MIVPQTHLSKLLYTTTRITAHKSNGKISQGTAFFFRYAVDYDRYLQVLVTNKHVIEGSTLGSFYVHEASKDGSTPTEISFELTVQDFENQWVSHPGGEDLCAMSFEPLRQRELVRGKKIFTASFDELSLPIQETLNDLSPMEDIIMAGYPIGLWDEVNNFPLLRRGVTASHPALDFNGTPMGVVDIAVFPGSSGSPILITNENDYTTPRGLHLKGGRHLLLGIVSSGPLYKRDGSISIIDVPTAKVPVVSTRIPIHLGYYIKAKKLVDFKSHIMSSVDEEGYPKN